MLWHTSKKKALLAAAADLLHVVYLRWEVVAVVEDLAPR